MLLISVLLSVFALSMKGISILLNLITQNWYWVLFLTVYFIELKKYKLRSIKK